MEYIKLEYLYTRVYIHTHTQAHTQRRPYYFLIWSKVLHL